MKVAHLSEPAEERVIFRDGLGVREWRDTGAGERVEWFHLDPCFAGVELPLRDRVTRLAKLQHVKFARILSIEPARKGAGPVLVSSHVPGTRFSEVLEMAAHGLVTVEPATAVQITREVIGALVILHDSRNVTHGALAPERLVLTTSGRVIVAEHALAAALDRLTLPRHQLWRDWRIATPPSPGPTRFDVRTDLAQLGLLALAAMLGRAIDEDEYPHRLRGLLPLAQDKLARSPLAAIAPDLVAWLERLVPVESRRAFTSVKEAQQAFEAFVSARATSMIIAPARVKGLMSAVAALSASTAPSVPAAPADAAPTVIVAAAPPTAVAAVAAPETASVTDEIDIDALLRLEAELEGGNPVVTRPAADRPLASTPPTTVEPVAAAQASLDGPAASPAEVQHDATPSLASLEHERADLERQFAALVAAVAPASHLDDVPAVRLRPETPDAVDSPLVDPLVRWSSMPGSDLPETPSTREEDPAPAEVAGTDATDASAPESAFSFQPLVIAAPEADAPAAALDHVPTAWWREALPWRDDPAASSDEPPADVTASLEPAVVSEAPAVEPIGETVAEEMPVTADEPLADIAGVAELSASADESAVTLDAVSAEHVEDLDPAIDETPVARLEVDVDGREQGVTPDEPAAPASLPELTNVDVVAPESVGVVLTEQDGTGELIDAAVDVAPGATLVQDTADTVVEVLHVVDMEPAEAHTDAATSSLVVEEPLLEEPSAWQTEAAEEQAALAAPVPLAVGADAVDAEPADAVTTAVDVSPSIDVLTPLEQMVAWHADVVDEPTTVRSSSGAGEAPIAVVEEPLVDGWQVDAVDQPSVADGSAWRMQSADEPVVAVPAAIAGVESSLVADAPLAITEIDDAPEDVAQTDSGADVDLGRRADVASESLVVSAALEPTVPERDDVEPAARTSLFGAFADLRLQVDEEAPASTEDAPSLRPTFAFLQVDTPPPTAASSLLARQDEIPPVEESSWRTAFEAEAPTATPFISGAVDVPAEEVESPAALERSPEMCADVDAAVAVDRAPASSPVPEPLPVPEAAPVAAPEVEPAIVPAPAATSDIEPEMVPEVVIVDGGADAHAFDTLAPELPSTPAHVEAARGVIDNADGLADDDPVAEEEARETRASHDDSASTMAPVTSGGKKKRRRVRRKKPLVASPEGPAGVVDVARPIEIAPVAPNVSIAPPLPTSVAPSASPDAPTIVADEAPLGGRRSLLEREVPTWTPPADLGAVARAAAPRAISVPTPDVMPTVDEWSTGTAAAALQAPVAAAPTAVAPMRSTRQAMPVPVEPPRAEETIRAVGMPDLEELGLSTGHGSVTSMADALGAHPPARHSVEPRSTAVPAASQDSRGSWNWRRLVAASVLIALFNGAAFAAWWWVQPGAHGTLVVQTAQPGVEVALDGKVLGKTPFRQQVAPGRHKLTLRQGVSVREMPVEISLGVVTTQSLDWPAADASARGNLQVSSTPAGAEILIDGKSLGKAPQLLEDLPAGNLEMTLRSDAGTVTVTATVIAGETTPFEVPIFAGWVIVDAPIELNIVLRGARIGANTDGQILLSPGRHQLMAVNEALGFRKPFTVLIEPGEVRRVGVTVPPAPLQVQDEPGSEVFVDGERVGALPEPLHIPLGTHDVLIRRPDQTERRQTVTVKAGDTVVM